MKTVLSLLFFLLVTVGTRAQDQTLETKSVTLVNLIAFIADNFPATNNNIEEDQDEEEVINQFQITFLLETTKKNFSSEDEIILKQAFKFLSSRLSNKDAISIVVYSGQNGLLLDNESPTALKKILHAISNVKKNIIEDYDDGIGEAYSFANQNLSTETNNLVVMVRNPDAKGDEDEAVDEIVKAEVTNSKTNNGSIVLLTALTLLPELIEVIKD